LKGSSLVRSYFGGNNFDFKQEKLSEYFLISNIFSKTLVDLVPPGSFCFGRNLTSQFKKTN